MNFSTGTLGIIAAAYGVAACLIGRNAMVLRRAEGQHTKPWLEEAWQAIVGVLRHGIKVSRRTPPKDNVNGRPIWFAFEGAVLLLAASVSAWLAYASNDGVSRLEGSLGSLLGWVLPISICWIALETYSVHKHSQLKVRPPVGDLYEARRRSLSSGSISTEDASDPYVDAMRKLDEKISQGPRSKEEVESTLREWDARQLQRWQD